MVVVRRCLAPFNPVRRTFPPVFPDPPPDHTQCPPRVDIECRGRCRDGVVGCVGGVLGAGRGDSVSLGVLGGVGRWGGDAECAGDGVPGVDPVPSGVGGPVVVVAVGGECYVCWGGEGVLEDAGDVGVDGGDWVWGVVVFVGG